MADGLASYEFTGTAMPEAMEKVTTRPTPKPSNQSTGSNGIVITVNEDGSVSFNEPKAPAIRRPRKDNFDENLAESLPSGTLNMLAEEYLDGVAQDIMSRSEFIANYNRGIDLLGLKIEEASATKGPRKSISKVKHPALLEACVRYQSAARAELLPAEGPVKIATVGASGEMQDDLARAFESDFNYFCTDIAREFYPDTDRMLFYQGYGGTAFKKVYRCPIRKRPVSESVHLTNLIVSEDATDLESAIRITNELLYSPAQVKRMQLTGGWVDVSLGYPQQNLSPARRKILESQGVSPIRSSRPMDQLFTIYEGYCDAEPRQYGFDDPFAGEGWPVPYRLTMDRDSRKVLEVKRNWRNGDESFLRRKTFVKYGLIPGLGFLDYGYLHLVGNQTRVLTSILQILIDAGMLSNFPGGMRVKGVRTSTNEINPGLGEFVELDIAQMSDIRQAIMGMPYKDCSPALMELMKIIETNVQRMSGAVDLEVGEGRSNVPVGTIMALIEQQTQVMGAVHKRNHTAQKDELMLLRECFLEDPQALVRLARKPARQWQTADEFSDLDLSPASDPNVPSQMHRIMQANVLEQMAAGDPANMKRKAVHKRSMRSMGISDGDDLMFPGPDVPPTPPQGPQAAPNPIAAIAAKAQLELPLKQREQALKEQKQGLEQAKLVLQQHEQQRQAADQITEAHQREQDRVLEGQIRTQELDLDRDRLHFERAKHDMELRQDHVHHLHEQAQQFLDRDHQTQLSTPTGEAGD